MPSSGFDSLPKPGSDDHKWSKIYKGFLASGDIAGYVNYLNTQKGMHLTVPGPSGPSGASGPAGTSGPAPGASGPAATAPLPPPPSDAGSNWKQAYKAYQANPTAGYGAYYSFLAGKPAGQALLAAGNYPAPGAAGAPGSPVPPTTGPGIGTGPGLTPPGTTTLKYDDPNTLGLYNRDPNWLANFTTPASAFGTAPTGGTATPAPVVPPAGSTGAGGGGSNQGGGTTQGGGSSSGTNGTGGNAGGASHGEGGGGAGDNAGHPGAGNASGGNAPGFAAGAGGGLASSINGNGLGGLSGINLGPLGAGILQAAAAGVPGWGGVGLSALQAALRGVNTGVADQNNRLLGAGGLDFGQILGSVLGLNNYGALGGNQTYVNRDGTPGRPGVAVTEGGMYDNGFLGGGPFGIFSDPRTSDTFQESVRRHNIAQGIAANGMPTGGNSLTGQGVGGAPLTGQSAAQVNRYGGVTAATPTLSGKEQKQAAAKQALYNEKNGYGSGGAGASDHSGQSMGNTSNASGQGNASGAGIGGLSGHDTTAVGASGQLGHIATGGYVGDHMAKGGDMPSGMDDPTTALEARLIHNALMDKYGPKAADGIMERVVGPMMGPAQPAGDRYSHRVRPLPNMLGMTPDSSRMPVAGDSRDMGTQSARQGEMFREMDADRGAPKPMARPMARPAGLSDADLLNWQEAAKHGARIPPEIAQMLAQRFGTALPPGIIPRMAAGGMVRDPGDMAPPDSSFPIDVANSLMGSADEAPSKKKMSLEQLMQIMELLGIGKDGGGGYQAKPFAMAPMTGGGMGSGMAMGGPVDRQAGGGIPGDRAVGDTVPIHATPGEFMINQRSADNLGPNLLNALNNPEVAGWLGKEMAGFGGGDSRSGRQRVNEATAPKDTPHPHLSDAFMAAVMHPRHGDRLANFMDKGWSKSWA